MLEIHLKQNKNPNPVTVTNSAKFRIKKWKNHLYSYTLAMNNPKKNQENDFIYINVKNNKILWHLYPFDSTPVVLENFFHSWPKRCA